MAISLGTYTTASGTPRYLNPPLEHKCLESASCSKWAGFSSEYGNTDQGDAACPDVLLQSILVPAAQGVLSLPASLLDRPTSGNWLRLPKI
eukprot:329279-Amphidinium_carterae.1